MSHSFNQWIAVAGLAGLLMTGAPARAALDDSLGFERTPPRLSFVEGDVSFFRPGDQSWEPASVNTPLAAGDELYAAEAAKLEIQIGARAYLRAGEETQLALTSLEPDFLQISVPEGHVSLDLRSVKPSQTFEIETPNASFRIENSGYYRVEVTDDATSFITRRGGRARVTPASGAEAALVAGEQVVISGGDAPQLATYAAPDLDAWDRWNYARTEAQLDVASARYVPDGVYGVDDLDRHGSWRTVPNYGSIWVPRGVAAGWAPYSTGRWIHDPHYGWSWVDAAPWGWAPYHYGRWVHVSGYWGWAPGPVVVRPRYAPALVAFFGGGGLSVGVSIGLPHIGWLALGWGEPIVPWWGPRGVRGVPHWAGWGGPRIVNNVVVNRRTVIHVNDIRHYRHRHARNAFVAVDRKHFGRRGVADRRIREARVEKYAHVRGDLKLRPARERRLASNRAAQRPPRERHERSSVAKRRPQERHERSSLAKRRPQVALASKSEAPRRGADSRRPKGRARKNGGDGERATPQEPPRHRSKRSGEAAGRKERLTRAPNPRERAAPASRQARTRKPRSKHTQLARAEAPAPRAPRETRRAGEDRRAPRRESAKPTRVRSEKRARAESRAPQLPSKPASPVFRKRGKQSQPKAVSSVSRKRGTQSQPKAAKTLQVRRNAKASPSRKGRGQRNRGRRS